MKISDVLGDQEDNLEILLSMGAIEIDQNLVRQTLESGSAGAFDRLKRIVHRGGNTSQKVILLEALVSMRDKYAREGIRYAQELVGQISDDLLLSAARNAFSYLFNYQDSQLLKTAVTLTEAIEARNGRALESTDNQNLGKAYYSFALDGNTGEDLDTAIMRFEKGTKKGEEYANALLIRGLGKENGWFERGVEAYDFSVFDVQKTVNLIEQFNVNASDYKAAVRIGTFMVASDNTAIFDQGMSNLTKAYELSTDTQKEELFGQMTDLYKRKADNKISDLITRAATDLFRSRGEKAKKTLVEKLFSLKNKELSELAAGFVEELAVRRETFDTLFQYGCLLSENGLLGQAGKLYDQALAVEKTYGNLVKVGDRLLQDKKKDDAVTYYRKALGQRATPAAYQKTADDLLVKNLEELALDFYKKSMGKNKSVTKCKKMGERVLRLGSRAIATRLLGYAAEKAKSLEGYIETYKPLLSKVSEDEQKKLLKAGLQRFNDLQDYKAALDYVEQKYGLSGAGQFAAELKPASDKIKKLCTSYTSRYEKEVEQKKVEKAKQEELIKRQRIEEELQRIEEARELVELRKLKELEKKAAEQQMQRQRPEHSPVIWFSLDHVVNDDKSYLKKDHYTKTYGYADYLRRKKD